MGAGVFVAASCKINTHLRIFDRRPDGFHDIQSVFQALDFGDSLTVVSLKECSACEVLMDGPVPPEQNIVSKAVLAFRRASGFDGGVRIQIDKKVPLGAGLGGGSSDAAATLIALNRLSGAALSLAKLEEAAQTLGSDVPFFLFGGTAIVEGRGERVTNVPAFLDYGVVLVHPGFPSDTGRAYSLLDQARLEGGMNADSDGGSAGPRLEDLYRYVVSKPSDWPFRNDFYPVLRKQSSEYDRMIGALRSEGAVFASLSGSGSACFGIFPDPGASKAAASRLKGRWPFVLAARPLARSMDAVLQ
jgi:4-diphosphocytidyl-2-C-methyl-D-erythritol kinase